jgi:hypothetical protein
MYAAAVDTSVGQTSRSGSSVRAPQRRGHVGGQFGRGARKTLGHQASERAAQATLLVTQLLLTRSGWRIVVVARRLVFRAEGQNMAAKARARMESEASEQRNKRSDSSERANRGGRLLRFRR